MARAWHVSCRWSVEANTDVVARTHPRPNEHRPGGWREVYCTKTKAQAKKDAKAWREQTGQPTRVVPGAGHKTRRGF